MKRSFRNSFCLRVVILLLSSMSIVESFFILDYTLPNIGTCIADIDVCSTRAAQRGSSWIPLIDFANNRDATIDPLDCTDPEVPCDPSDNNPPLTTQKKEVVAKNFE